MKTIPGQLLAYLTAFAFAVFWIVSGTPRSWSATLPDDVHTYGIRFKGGVDLYFRPAIGWFVEHGLWMCLGLAAAAALTEGIVRATAHRRG